MAYDDEKKDVKRDSGSQPEGKKEQGETAAELEELSREEQ